MLPIYRQDENKIQIKKLKIGHVAPHLHNAIEFIYIQKGSMELGVGTDFTHMEAGDFAVVFPNLIHHFQVFQEEHGQAIHIKASPQYLLSYADLLTGKRPVNPVIQAKDANSDIPYIIQQLIQLEQEENIHGNRTVLQYAYIQVLLARSIPFMELYNRENPKTHDIVYQSVIYIAEHFRENISLSQMARDLGVSQYTLSRVFSSTFHQNFNQYINRVRLGDVIEELTNSTTPITEIAMNAGFQSQATFNRVFQERYHMTPRAYRNANMF